MTAGLRLFCACLRHALTRRPLRAMMASNTFRRMRKESAMHRKLIASAVLALLLMMIALPACAAYCTACGVSISDSAHLCPRCGARQMPSSSALTITRLWSNGDGSITVSWSGGTAPYTIDCVQMLGSSIASDLADGASLGMQAASTAVYDGRTGTADRLVPGQDYWIVVRDAKGKLDYQAWIPGKAPAFADFPVDVALQFRGFPGGADVHLIYPILPDERGFTVLCCITAPNGAVMTLHVEKICLPAGSTSFCLGLQDMTAYSDLLEERFGHVPTGVYTWSVYLDGMYAGGQDFSVTD